MDKKIEQPSKVKVSFAAIDQYVVDNVIKPIEGETKRGFITWGENNDYPEYINSLYNNVATLKSIIDGLVDYILGDKININLMQFKTCCNRKGQKLEEVIKWLTKDYVCYGGFALNIIRNRLGSIAEINYLDFKNLRTNEDKTKFYYSKNWSKSFGRVKYLEYPAFIKNTNDKKDIKNNINSVFYFSNEINKVYPTPIYGASLEACEIEKAINNYHINNIKNGFSSNYIVNFNNGQPDDQQKEEIEENFYEKFTGSENAGRPMLAFNDSKENETTISKIETEDFSTKYESLSKRSKQELFTAFRATPNLFGITTETTGFSEQEYSQAFKLFNRTMVKPMQQALLNALNGLLTNTEDKVITIEPFTIEWEQK